MEDVQYAVICVDDDPYILQMLSFQLSKIVDSRYTLLEYYTKPEEVMINIEELVKDNIKIIFALVDFQMPTMSGADLIKDIKASYPDLTCVMLSGQANKKSLNELKKQKLLDNFIPKPWDEEVLFEIIRPILLESAL